MRYKVTSHIYDRAEIDKYFLFFLLLASIMLRLFSIFV
jgi:hypothetical protein